MEKAIGQFHARMSGRPVKYDLTVNGKPVDIKIVSPGTLSVNGQRVHAKLLSQEGTVDLLKVGERRHKIYLRKIEGHCYEVWINHFVITVNLSDERDQLLDRYQREHSPEKSILTVRAPMPGIVTKLHTRVGESVPAGGGLLILEAMKMENEICSPNAGKVRAVMVKEKTTVEKDQPLLTLEPD